MKNVEVCEEQNSIHLHIEAHTAAKACRVVELVTTMDHSLKWLDRTPQDCYALMKVYCGSEEKSEQVAKHLNML